MKEEDNNKDTIRNQDGEKKIHQKMRKNKKVKAFRRLIDKLDSGNQFWERGGVREGEKERYK